MVLFPPLKNNFDNLNYKKRVRWDGDGQISAKDRTLKFSNKLVNLERMKKEKMDKKDKKRQKRQKRQLQVFNAIFVHGQSVMLSAFCP